MIELIVRHPWTGIGLSSLYPYFEDRPQRFAHPSPPRQPGLASSYCSNYTAGLREIGMITVTPVSTKSGAVHSEDATRDQASPVLCPVLYGR